MIHVTGVVVTPYMGRGRPHMYLSGVVPIYGRSEHNWLSKEDTSSSTVSTEGLMLSYIIEAMEGQDVATADIPGYFLQNYYYKGDIYINMEG